MDNSEVGRIAEKAATRVTVITAAYFVGDESAFSMRIESAAPEDTPKAQFALTEVMFMQLSLMRGPGIEVTKQSPPRILRSGLA